MQHPARFQELLDDYVGDKTGPGERAELLGMVRSGQFQGLLEQHITDSFAEEKLEGPVLSTWQKEKILQNIFAEARHVTPVIAMESRKRFTWQWVAAAAILVTVTVGAGIFYRSHRSNQLAVSPTPAPVPARPVSDEVVPGGYKATLTLADASEVPLDADNGSASWQQGQAHVSNVNGRELVYSGPATQTDKNAVIYNKVSTPRGGQYQIVLPDGSKVWLNAASTLRFPIAFAGEERNVLLTGEAYFEVNSHPSAGGQQNMPFTVTVGGNKVTVLGTHFNIKAYDDEKTLRTTLLEGAVKISSGQASSLLKPGQQAQIQSNATGLGLPSATIRVVKTDAANAVAWKDGFFAADASDVPGFLRQVARWYDLDLEIQTPVLPLKQFGGKISKDQTIADLVKILETNGIHVKVEARTRKMVVTS
ncbi:MAG: FecR domain-containing protein [Bacteroidetes bacterium]|nr:FecR domain-containing protein [Bacteroidota bacterium]